MSLGLQRPFVLAKISPQILKISGFSETAGSNKRNGLVEMDKVCVEYYRFVLERDFLICV